MFPVVQLRQVVEANAATTNPTRNPDTPFIYVDVAAVDNESKTITGAREVLGADAPSRARKRIKKGDILVSTVRPNLNAVAVVPPELDGQIASTGFAVLRPTEKVLSQYLFYFVRSRAFVQGLTGLVTGAMYPAVTDRQVLDQLLPLPEISEQRRIVDLLSRAEGIVRLRREAQKKAAEIIPALFVDMFGDPATNPKGWLVARLGDIADVVSGITKGRKLNGKATKPVPYLRVANVQAGYLDLTETKEIEATPAEIEDLRLLAGDIVLTEGGDYDKLGRGAQWRGEIEPCIHQNHVFRVRLRPEAVEPDYFEAYLQTQAATRYFLSVAKRTTNLASINMTQLRDLPVTLPPIEPQRSFVERVVQVRSIQLQVRAAGVAAQSTFDALLARVFSQKQAATKDPDIQPMQQRTAVA